MTKSYNLLHITFYVENKLYQATIYKNKPMAIIIPDKHLVIYTVLCPKPDTSTEKNRYGKVVNPSEQEETKIDLKHTTRQKRTVFSDDNVLNGPMIAPYKEDEPFVCHRSLVTIATPALYMAY